MRSRSLPSPTDLVNWIRSVAAQGDLSQARQLHATLAERCYCFDKQVTNQVMRMFGKCGSVEDARRIFDEIEAPDTAQWNIVVTAYAQNGHLDKAKFLFERTPHRDSFSWNTIAQACSSSRKFEEASQTLRRMPEQDVVSYNTLLSAYAQGGHMQELQALFETMPERDVISWNIAISQHAEADSDRAKLLFDRAPQHSVVTWNVLIAHHREESKRMFDAMPSRDIVSWNSLVNVSEMVDQAQETFSKMACHDAISWITITSANATSGHIDKALELFDRSPKRSLALWNVILSGFANIGDVGQARFILDSMPRTDAISWNALLGALLEFSSLDEAAELFAAMPHRNLSSWTLLVGGYSQHSNSPRDAATILLVKMPQWDAVPWNAVLSAMARTGDADGAKDIFDRMKNLRNVVSWTILCELNDHHSEIPLEAYSKMPVHVTAAVLAVIAANAYRQCWNTARYLFETLRYRTLGIWNAYLALCVAQPAVAKPAAVLGRMPQWNAVSWNTIVAISRKSSKMGTDPDEEESRLLIAVTSAAAMDSSSTELATTLIVAYALNGDTASAKSVFDDTARRDVVAWTAMLTASSVGQDVDRAAAVHRRMPAWNVVCWNALVSAYAQNGHTAAARAAFSAMPERNLRSWNSITAALVQNSEPRLALDLFEQKMDLAPNEVTLTTLLDACGELGDLAAGITLHDLCVKLRLDRHSVVATALLDMYARCGRVDLAKNVFDSMRRSIDLVAWNAMIAGFARNGHSLEALELYNELETLGQLKADASTLAAAIDACSSAVPPAVREGSAIHQRAIASGMDRDTVVGSSLVAMYTKVGRLNTAKQCFDKITAKNTVAWNSMLVGFANHGSVTFVLENFHLMQLDGSAADDVTFVAAIGSFAHAGWIIEAGQFFHSMAIDFSVAATPEHYSAIGDLLARLGRIGDARELIDNKPFESGSADWMSLLSACRIQCEIEQGTLAAAEAFGLGQVDDAIATCKLLLGIPSVNQHSPNQQLRHTLGVVN